MRVLLIEDDPMIGAAIHAALQEAAYAADWVKDGQAGAHALSCQHYDLVLLDLGLPKQDGQSLLQQIRQQGNAVPLLILTARDSLDERLRGLDNGADDYLLKPFDMAELLARMRAVLRRKGGSASSTLSNGALCLDLLTKEVQVCQEDVQDDAPKDAHAPAPPRLLLSQREFSLLQALLIRPGAILSRSELEDRIYGWGQEVESNAVEYLIHSLRRKLGSAHIKNVRGLGWMVPKKESRAP